MPIILDWRWPGVGDLMLSRPGAGGDPRVIFGSQDRCQQEYKKMCFEIADGNLC